MEKDWWRQGIAEGIGAFALVFVGAGSVAATAGLTAEQALVTRALAHGVVIMAFASALAHLSGGQISPAVTFGLWVARRIKGDLAAAIVAFQLLGSVLAGLALLAIYPGKDGGLGTPGLAPSIAGNPAMGILVEAILTFDLVFVVFATAVDSRGAAKQISALAIGLTVAADWFVGGSLTGAAMSFGRWLGPAIASGDLTWWYAYLVGPFLGGGLAAALYRAVFLPPVARAQ